MSTSVADAGISLLVAHATRFDARPQNGGKSPGELLVRLYGEDRGKAVKHAETFELCEYGARPNGDELRRLFPFFDK